MQLVGRNMSDVKCSKVINENNSQKRKGLKVLEYPVFSGLAGAVLISIVTMAIFLLKPAESKPEPLNTGNKSLELPSVTDDNVWNAMMP